MENKYMEIFSSKQHEQTDKIYMCAFIIKHNLKTANSCLQQALRKK